MAVVQRRLQIHGRVQGVNYRASCANTARRLGVTGEVCNRPDGTVEVVAQGEAAAVDRLVAWCWLGPSLADVDDVQVSDEAVGPRRDCFSVG